MKFGIPYHGSKEVVGERLDKFLDLCEVGTPSPPPPPLAGQSSLSQAVDQVWTELFETPSEQVLSSDQASAPAPSGTMEHGKYAGYSFEEVLESDPGYAGYIVKTAQSGDSSLNWQAFADWAADKDLVDPDLQIGFGKYKGHSFMDVLRTDPDYCYWIFEKSQNEEVGGSMLRFVDWLSKNGMR